MTEGISREPLRNIFVNVAEISSIHESAEYGDTIILSMRNGEKFHIHDDEIMNVVNRIKKVHQAGTGMLVELDLSKLELR